MRRSRFMQNEILQLLGEASAGVPVADICEAAGVTPRTFYRWRRQFGGLDVPAVRQMKELVSENLRLRGLVSNLFEQLRTPADSAQGERRKLKATAPPDRRKGARSDASEPYCRGKMWRRAHRTLCFRSGQSLRHARLTLLAIPTFREILPYRTSGCRTSAFAFVWLQFLCAATWTH